MSEQIEVRVEDGSGSMGPVPVEPLGDDRYRLWYSDPFGTSAFGDVVRAERVDETTLRIIEVVEPSRWRTFETLLSRELIKSDAVRALLRSWEERGIHWEIVFGGMLSVSVPPDMDCDPRAELDALLSPPNSAT